MNSNPPPGQLSETERQYLYDQVKIIGPRTVLESGTWYGGGSTLSITRALHDLGTGGVLHTWEEHAPFHEVAQTFYAASDYSASIVLHRGSFVDGVSAADDAFLADVSMVFLDGGDEGPDGHHKLPDQAYLDDYNLSENVQSFKILERRLRPGSHIMLHDWSVTCGRGAFVRAYLSRTGFRGFELVTVVETTTGLAHLVKK